MKKYEKTIRFPSDIVDRIKKIADYSEVSIKDLVLSWVLPMIEECEFAQEFQETFNFKIGGFKNDRHS